MIPWNGLGVLFFVSVYSTLDSSFCHWFVSVGWLHSMKFSIFSSVVLQNGHILPVPWFVILVECWHVSSGGSVVGFFVVFVFWFSEYPCGILFSWLIVRSIDSNCIYDGRIPWLWFLIHCHGSYSTRWKIFRGCCCVTWRLSDEFWCEYRCLCVLELSLFRWTFVLWYRWQFYVPVCSAVLSSYIYIAWFGVFVCALLCV